MDLDTSIVAGIDEVGRGCIAGPVVAAIVILDPANPIAGLKDSKTISPRRRTLLSQCILEKALDWSIGRAEVSEITSINILQATLLAMQRAYQGLHITPDWVWVDGNRYPEIPCHGDSVVQGDRLIAEISAASIIAKVHRDREMNFYDVLFPGYCFSKHKGYPTQHHVQQLKALGVTAVHRPTFTPVNRLLIKAM